MCTDHWQDFEKCTVHDFSVEMTPEQQPPPDAAPGQQQAVPVQALPPIVLSLTPEQVRGQKAINWIAEKRLSHLTASMLALLMRDRGLIWNPKTGMRVAMAQLLLNIGYPLDRLDDLLPPEKEPKGEGGEGRERQEGEAGEDGGLDGLFDEASQWGRDGGREGLRGGMEGGRGHV